MGRSIALMHISVASQTVSISRPHTHRIIYRSIIQQERAVRIIHPRWGHFICDNSLPSPHPDIDQRWNAIRPLPLQLEIRRVVYTYACIVKHTDVINCTGRARCVITYFTLGWGRVEAGYAFKVIQRSVCNVYRSWIPTA